MPIFEYVAISKQGKKVKGSVEADTIRAARQKLRTQGIFPTDIAEGSEVQQKKTQDVLKYLQSDRVGLKDLGSATRQLATLVNAGLPLVQALSALAGQVEAPVLKRILTDVREQVQEGSSFAQALKNFPKAFPRLYINMVASGEASGKLDTVLENLADYLEAQLELQRKVTSALFYPALMFVFCVLVVIALLAFVVPTIVEIFEKQGGVLPLPTRILIFISDSLINYWWLLIGLVVGSVLGLRAYFKTANGRDRLDRAMLKAPLIGNLYRKVVTARVSGTLSTLLSSGVGLLAAMDIVRNIVANTQIQRLLEEARDGVKEGRSLAKELSKGGLFPPLLSSMVAVGEQSGQLEQMLGKASKAYNNEVNAALAGLTSLIEPIMIIGLGGVVFSVVISILMPMTEMVNLVK